MFVVGAPSMNLSAIDDYLDYRDEEWKEYNQEDIYSIESLIEAAGRVCYQSWNNPAKRTTHDYISEQIIGAKHGSVLEHVYFNLLVADLPRSSQLELVRHGDGTAFSFESTRFVDKHMRFIAPPHIRDDRFELTLFESECLFLSEAYERRVETLSERYRGIYGDDKTLARKRAKEAARSMLPNALGSDGMVSVNGRSLRWIIESRSNEHADLSIREFAWALYNATHMYAPSLFSDVTLTNVFEGPPQINFTYSKV